jgi:hypothetical protein
MPRKTLAYEDAELRELLAKLHGVTVDKVKIKISLGSRFGGEPNVKFQVEDYTREPFQTSHGEGACQCRSGLPSSGDRGCYVCDR